ncbi:YkgJ family cysteine cluster protein [uncultured Cytophaga sp.]|uniref:YkgJ family cysteine cluster protein n=1 Tax=uncultured Cytophaga sp. TaxID=160238 RepID=UPI00262BFA7B|nr:YkgJ family cysteine cluster protein [uncultured Cytophaga sp.]
MSHLEDISLQVVQFYLSLDSDLASFQKQANYGCITGCSKCCTSPNIEATILEMLPYAFHLYKDNQAETIYDSLLSNKSPICSLYKTLQTETQKGGCSDYAYRALVCRLFGSSFTRDKSGESTLLACKDIKSTFPTLQVDVNKQAHDGLQVPLATNYYNQLSDIDYNLSKQQYPINEAMRLAIEMVLNHFHYSDPSSEDHKNAS